MRSHSFMSGNNNNPVNRSGSHMGHKNISIKVEENIDNVKKSLLHSSDLIVRNLEFANRKIGIVFIDTLIKGEVLESQIIQQIIQNPKKTIEETVSIKDIKTSSSFDEIVVALVKGNAVIFTDNEGTAIILNIALLEGRSIEQPDTEQVLRGAQDGFIETLETNINLLRRRINNPNLVVKYVTLGRESDTSLAIVYVDSIANDDLVKEVERRISYIDVDYVSNIEEYIEDNSFSPFPQMLTTSRPDRVSANLMDGRVAIITDGSPSVLVMPITFFSFYQTTDDYNSRWMMVSFFRLMRMLSFIISISLPALYIALVSYHFEIIPIELVSNVKSSLEYIPFPPLIEALSMQITLELLRESAIRLPSPISQTLGVVGGLVIGTAVVEANLISNTMLVVISITAISSFAAPDSEMGTSVRLLGFPLMFAAATIGLIGIVFGLMIILIHLCKLESFGTPYFAPFAPLRRKDLKDTIYRVPMWKMTDRPRSALPKKLRSAKNPRGWKQNE